MILIELNIMSFPEFNVPSSCKQIMKNEKTKSTMFDNRFKIPEFYSHRVYLIVSLLHLELGSGISKFPVVEGTLLDALLLVRQLPLQLVQLNLLLVEECSLALLSLVRRQVFLGQICKFLLVPLEHRVAFGVVLVMELVESALYGDAAFGSKLGVEAPGFLGLAFGKNLWWSEMRLSL